MSFLTPLYLLGLAAVALPVLFHLIRRQPRGRRVFSTVMFLDPSPPTVTRRSRLENWPLLLLRAAALCLLALAFARPLMRELLGTGAKQDPGERVVVLLDISASMRRDHLWDEAVRRVETIVAQSRPADRLAIMAFDREVRTLLAFDEWAAVDAAARKRLVSERMVDVSPGWAAAHLDQALTAATELLHAPHSSESPVEGRKRIVLISDLAEGSRVQGLAGREWPKDVAVTIVRVEPRSRTNAGLQLVAGAEETGVGEPRTTEFHFVRLAGGENRSLEDETDPLDAKDPVVDLPPARGRSGTLSYAQAQTRSHIRVCVTNASDSSNERFQLAWQAATGGTLPQAAPIDVYCPPGQSRVLRVAVPAGVELPARIVLRGDDHGFDNLVSVDQPASEPVHVLLYSGESADDPAGLRFYLEQAFVGARPVPVMVTSQPPDAPGPVPVPRDVPLVIATEAPARDRLPGLRRYIEQGGTLLIVAANTGVCDLWKQLFGSQLQAAEANVAGYAMLSAIDFGHPLFAPFNDPRFADFTNVRVWRHRELELETMDAGSPRVLASFDSGSPAIIEQPLGRGRVVLLAFGWHPADSQLALSTKFVPLLHALVGLAAGQDAAPRRLIVGDALPLAGRTLDAGAEVTVLTPDRRTVRLAAGQGAFRDTVVPGIYRIAMDGRRERSVAIGLPPEEIRTAPLALEQLEALGVRLAAPESLGEGAARATRERQLRIEELESRQKHWRWLILAALAVLVCETWLAGSLARRGMNSQIPEANRS